MNPLKPILRGLGALAVSAIIYFTVALIKWCISKY